MFLIELEPLAKGLLFLTLSDFLADFKAFSRLPPNRFSEAGRLSLVQVPILWEAQIAADASNLVMTS